MDGNKCILAEELQLSPRAQGCRGRFAEASIRKRGSEISIGFQQMPAPRKWTEEEISEIKRHYREEGLAVVQVGKKFNASKT